MRASFLTAIAALAASAVSTPISVGEVYAFINGAKFRLNVPAGYADGAPTFDGKFQSQNDTLEAPRRSETFNQLMIIED
ncbi:hypothetical protein F4823DRAFT_563432 [Ustulina deusta]|nr:hypothetical protein F4823DRAFT_563432 [Ustulina deusta]